MAKESDRKRQLPSPEHFLIFVLAFLGKALQCGNQSSPCWIEQRDAETEGVLDHQEMWHLMACCIYQQLIPVSAFPLHVLLLDNIHTPGNILAL